MKKKKSTKLDCDPTGSPFDSKKEHGLDIQTSGSVMDI